MTPRTRSVLRGAAIGAGTGWVLGALPIMFGCSNEGAFCFGEALTSKPSGLGLLIGAGIGAGIVSLRGP